MTRRARLSIFGTTALVTVLAAAWLWPPAHRILFGPSGPANEIVVSGNIEAHQSVLSFTQISATIVSLPFDEGREVTTGTVLARVDDQLYASQVAIDSANLAVANAQVTVSESALDAAQHSVISDKYDLDEKQRDLARNEALVKTSAVSKQDRDRAFTAAGQSAAALERDQALLQQARDNIVLARATRATAEEKLKLDQVTLAYTTLRAPFNGVISVRQAELGELAGPGVAIVTLDDLDHIWLRAYVNEPDRGRIRLDQTVDVTTDSYPGHHYQGRISFISPEAEFTPKTVETHAERVTLVYRIRIDIPNPTHELLPGMPADANISLLPAGK